MDAPWKLVLVRGVIGILFGLVAVIWPIETAVALAVLWGVWALVDGMGLLADAFQGGAVGTRLLTGVMAAVGLLAGLYAILRPGATAVILTWVLGIWLIVRGGYELVGAFAPSVARASRVALALGAAVDFLLGLLFVANPGRGAVGIAWALGIIALAWGATFVGLAYLMRKQEQRPDLGAGQPTPA